MAEEREVLQDLREKIIRIEVLLEKIVDSNELKQENLEEKIKVANRRIERLEQAIAWLWRTVIGALIGGSIALLFK